MIGVFADTLYELDFHVGRILGAIEDAGISNNTLILLTGETPEAQTLTLSAMLFSNPLVEP